MTTTPEYDQLVEGFSRKLQEAKGNVTSKKMTPEETAQEIAQIQDGAISSFDSEPYQNAWKGQAPIGSMEPPNSQQPKKRGRPVGSKNRPKVK